MIFDAIFDDMFDEIFGHLDESRACGDSRALLMPVQLDLKPNRRKYAMLKLLIGPLSLKWLAFCALWVVVFCNRAFFGHLLASYPLAEGHVYFLGRLRSYCSGWCSLNSASWPWSSQRGWRQSFCCWHLHCCLFLPINTAPCLTR